MNTIRLLVSSLVIMALSTVVPAPAFSNSLEEVRQATQNVSEATRNLRFALDVFERSLRDGEGPLCVATPAEALEEGQRNHTILKRRLQELRPLLRFASVEQESHAAGVLLRARATMQRFNDALDWTASTGGISTVDWCSGFIDCIGLRHGCNGCFKCYDGLTDCGCFNPPDGIQGCR